MLQTLVIVAALRDLVPWIPVLVIIAALYALGIRIRYPGTGNRYYQDDDKM